MIAELLRLETSEAGTIGVLRLNKKVICYTFERPYLDNARNISSIPTGQYTCDRIQSPKFGKTFEVKNVPGRSHILFHKGNKLGDTSGCILIGNKVMEYGDERSILDSQTAFVNFLFALRNVDSFHLTIKEIY